MNTIWLKSLASAAAGAFLSDVAAGLASPTTFNFTRQGVTHLLLAGATGALIAVSHLLLPSPLSSGAKSAQ